MLTPGIYYPNRNAHRQLLNTLPGKNIYPAGLDFIYYSAGSVYYVNQMPTLPVDDVVDIYLNGVLHGTTPILDASGLYVYEFAPTYGALEVKSVFSNSTEATQTFFCVNLYTLLSAAADVWSPQRQANILLLANQYLTPQTTGIFRGQADQEWMSKSFGEAIGFPQPTDWPFARYAMAMGGYPNWYSAGQSIGAVYPAAGTAGSSGATGTDLLLTLWIDNDSAPTVTGYTGATGSDLEAWMHAARSGAKTITLLDGVFGATMAADIQSAVRGLTATDTALQPSYDNFTCEYSPAGHLNRFVLTSGSTGTNSSVVVSGGTVATACGLGLAAGGAELRGQSSLPGIYSALPKGSSTGAIKDIVQAVTGYRMSDEDFRQLQVIGWQLGRGYTGSYRYRYSGNPSSPVQDMDPTGVSGPHYFLAYNQFEAALPYEALLSVPLVITVNGTVISSSRFFARTEAGTTTVWIAGLVVGDSVTIAYTKVAGGTDTVTVTVSQLIGVAPIARLQSNIQQAYTVLLNVTHDGFFVDGESVLRNLSGTTDYLSYNWLNPWATIIEYTAILPLYWSHIGFTGAGHTLSVGATAQQGSEFISVDGNYLYPSQYTYTDAVTIELDPGLSLFSNSVVQMDYRMGGDVMSSYEEGVTGSVPYPYVVTLPASPAPLHYGTSVFVNGSRLSNTQYSVLANEITIDAQLYAGDQICVRFYTTGLNSYVEQTAIGKKRDFVFPTAVDIASVLVMINGERAPADAYTMPTTNVVRLSDAVYNNISGADITSVFVDVGLPSGYSVKIVQGATTYTQGTHFEVDYTHGQILWITGTPRPAAGSAYTVYYTYFPKQILERLLRLVQPATVRVLLQFATTLDQVFNPYFFEGVPNPSGVVIRPTI